MVKNANTVTKKASTKEIIMFAFACVILILPIFLFLPVKSPVESPVEVTNGFEVFAVMFLVYTYAIVGVILCVAIIIAWSVGLILSVKLALRKKRIPKWLYIASLILISLYLAGFIALILEWTLK